MCKVTNFFTSMSIISLAICFSSTAAAAPIIIDLNDFFTDPAIVAVESDGSSALITEDPVFGAALLSNQPSLGDVEVIIPGENTTLSFNYEFLEGAGNDDEFRVSLYDTDTYDTSPIVLADFFVGDIFEQDNLSGLVSFDLSDYVGTTLGLDFELRSFDGKEDEFLTSTVRISNLQLNTVAPVPEPSTVSLFLLGGLLLPFVRRRLK